MDPNAQVQVRMFRAIRQSVLVRLETVLIVIRLPPLAKGGNQPKGNSSALAMFAWFNFGDIANAAW